MHVVENDRGGHSALSQHPFACRGYPIGVMLAHCQQHFHKGPAAVGRFEQLVLYHANGRRQSPFLERRAVSERAGFLLQHWQAVPGIKYQPFPAKAANVPGNRPALGRHADPVREPAG